MQRSGRRRSPARSESGLLERRLLEVHPRRARGSSGTSGPAAGTRRPGRTPGVERMVTRRNERVAFWHPALADVRAVRKTHAVLAVQREPGLQLRQAIRSRTMAHAGRRRSAAEARLVTEDGGFDAGAERGSPTSRALRDVCTSRSSIVTRTSSGVIKRAPSATCVWWCGRPARKTCARETRRRRARALVDCSGPPAERSVESSSHTGIARRVARGHRKLAEDPVADVEKEVEVALHLARGPPSSSRVEVCTYSRAARPGVHWPHDGIGERDAQDERTMQHGRRRYAWIAPEPEHRAGLRLARRSRAACRPRGGEDRVDETPE